MGYYVHPERYSLSLVSVRKRLLVVHTSEGGELSTSDDQLIAAMGQPGDRILPDSNPPRMFGAAYHVVFDGDNEDYIEGPGPKFGVYAAGGANKWADHGCHPGRVSQTRPQWLDPRSRGQIRGCAKWMVNRHHRDGIEMRKLTVAEVRLTKDPNSGVTGYCGHRDVSLAFNMSDHTDPEPNYPWDVLAADIQIELGLPTPPEDDVLTALKTANRRYDSRLAGSGGVLHAGEVRLIKNISLGPSAFINITVIPQEAKGGYLSAWSGDDATVALSSNVNWGIGTRIVDDGNGGKTLEAAPFGPVANAALVDLGPDGSIYVRATTDVHLVIDLQGAHD